MPPAFVPSSRQLFPPWRMVLLLLATLGGCAWGQSAPPVAYDDGAMGKTGTVRKAALHEVIEGQTVRPSTATGTDTWDVLKVLDEDPLNPASVVLIYSGLTNGKTNGKTNQDGGGVGAGTWDREHLFPQS